MVINHTDCVIPFNCYFDGMTKSRFGWIGGALCLDFANTVGSHAGLRVSEKLKTWSDLVDWCREAGLIDSRVARELLRRSSDQPLITGRLLNTAVQFREALYRIFRAISQEEKPSPADLEILNEILVRAPITLRIQTSGTTLQCTRECSTLDDARLLGPIAWSAAELMNSEDRRRLVRQCANATCGWLFLDLTKNHSRRWCDMSDCGSRAKAHRYYQRKKQSAGALNAPRE